MVLSLLHVKYVGLEIVRHLWDETKEVFYYKNYIQK